MHPFARRPALGPRQWEEIRGWADRLEEAWQRGGDVDLTQFLPPPGSPLRAVVLEELIKTDLEIRWRRGLGQGVRNYLQRYPELSARPEALPGLLYEEYRVRHRFGDRPSPDGYREAYPDLFPAFLRLLEEAPLPPPRPPEPQPEPVGPLIVQQGNILPVGGAGYKLLQRIGLGGFGEVWRAEAPGGMPVAVKFINRPLDQEEAQRELRSLEIIKDLKNPFLLRTQAYWASADRLIVVMDLADGSLRDRLKECQSGQLRGVPGQELLGYFREAAEALDYMHGKNVLHRDVKPDNILLREGRVLVADFGLVRQQVRQDPTLSSSGTPPYMAPEAWRGKPTGASDQYSLACTWVELRLGRRPFSGDNAEVVIRVLTAMPDLDGLPPAERRVIARALEKDAKDRYPCCAELVHELERAVAECPDLPAAPATVHMTASSAVADLTPGGFSAPDAGALAPSVEDEDLNDMLNTIRSTNPSRPSPAAKRGNGWQRDTAEMSGGGWKAPPRRKPEAAVAVVAGVMAILVLSAVLLYFYRLTPIQPTSTEPAVVQTEPASKPPDPKPPDKPPVAAVKRMPAPEGFVAVGDEEVQDQGARYPKRIRSTRVNDPAGVFLYLPKKEEKEPPSFYLMENKLSNGVFRQFAEVNPDAVAASQWKKGGYEGGKDLNRVPEELPVYRVTHTEAAAAARWLGGRLPTPAELDMAAGYWHHPPDRPGPARGPKVAASITGGPWRINDPDSDDVSPLEIRDLAGNGEEWTSETFDVGGRTVAVTAGRSYLAPGPLLYEDLDRRQLIRPTQFPNRATPWTGFRVAVTPPPPNRDE